MKRHIQVAMLGLIGKAMLGLLQGLEIDLRKASLSRVCQPGPLLRKWSAMSASIRNVTFALVGAFCLPTGTPPLVYQLRINLNGRLGSLEPLCVLLEVVRVLGDLPLYLSLFFRCGPDSSGLSPNPPKDVLGDSP